MACFSVQYGILSVSSGASRIGSPRGVSLKQRDNRIISFMATALVVLCPNKLRLVGEESIGQCMVHTIKRRENQACFNVIALHKPPSAATTLGTSPPSRVRGVALFEILLIMASSVTTQTAADWARLLVHQSDASYWSAGSSYGPCPTPAPTSSCTSYRDIGLYPSHSVLICDCT
jgi:hypothetical protein